MRMSRVKRRQFKLQQKREQLYCRKKAAAVVLAGLTAGAPLKADAVTFTVLHNIHGDFDYMENNLARIKNLDLAEFYAGEAAKNMSLAQYYLDEAKMVCHAAAENLRMAKENQRQAETWVKELEASLTEARENRIQLTERAIATQQALADYLPVWYSAQAELQKRKDVRQAAVMEISEWGVETTGSTAVMKSQQERQRAEWIEAAWEEAGFENNRLPDLEMQFEGLETGGETITGGHMYLRKKQMAEAYWKRMAELDAYVGEAQEYFDSVSSHLDQLKEICRATEEQESEARRWITEMEIELDKNRQYALNYRRDVEICQEEQLKANKAYFQVMVARNDSVEAASEAEAALQHFGDWSGAQKTLEYYTWRGAARGHQFYTANSYYWSGCQRELFVSNADVYSDTGLPDGEMNGFTDTQVTGMYTNKHPVYDVKYGLSVNLPTGESRLHNNAVVPDYLARVSRLGEGWNFTPRLEVTRHIDKYTDLKWRSAYSFRGSYADSLDDLTSVVNPGDFWSNELEYIHTDDKKQYMMRLWYTHSGQSFLSGAVNNYSFQDGDGLAGMGYYRNWFTPRDSWGAYMICSFDQAVDYDDGSTGGAGLHRLYGGVGWFHQFDARRQLRLFANWLRLEGDAYEPLTKQVYSSGKRFSVSMSYDWRMDDKDSLSIDLERAVMQQHGAAGYEGWGVMVSYNRGF